MKKMIVAAFAAILMLTGCAGLSAWGEEVTRAFKGVDATFTTFDQKGQMMDNVKGRSIRVTRDDRFDGTNSDGTSKDDSQVLMVSVGMSHVSHVGSTAIIAQTGLTKVADAGSLNTTSTQFGVPILNDFIEKNRNLWKGKSKTILIRSQDGLPIAVYAGNAVESFKPDVPQSTLLRVDGQYLFVYRADMTIYDNDLVN